MSDGETYRELWIKRGDRIAALERQLAEASAERGRYETNFKNAASALGACERELAEANAALADQTFYKEFAQNQVNELAKASVKNIDTINTLEAALAEAVKGLQFYSDHSKLCAAFIQQPCTCGLDATLVRIEALKVQP